MDVSRDVVDIPPVKKRLYHVKHPSPYTVAEIPAGPHCKLNVLWAKVPDGLEITLDTEISQVPGLALEMDYVEHWKGRA